jgi:hypothetical protein
MPQGYGPIDSVSQETVQAVKAMGIWSKNSIKKASNTVTTATGLTAYDLQAPAKNLYPVNTPIRNSLPRTPGIGTATNWRSVTGITGSGFDSMGWVPEGQRAGAMSITVATKAASFRTLGDEEAISYEAVNAARGFEDIRATSTVRLLQKVMLKEENSLIGGNASIALGTAVAPTLSAAGTGATLPALTYSVIVVAMTFEGYRNITTIAAGLTQTKTITGQDGSTFTLNGGYGQKSTNTTQAVTLGQTLSCFTTAVVGAVAYAWYTGAAGSEKLEKITNNNSVTFNAPLSGTGQLASALTSTDNSTNAAVAYDGLLSTAYAGGSGAYVNTLATGTPGTGTVLTASNRGSINEIDLMFQTMWNNNQVSPTVLFVNAQELQNITNKVLQGGSGAPLARFNMDAINSHSITAGAVVGNYFNPYATNGGMTIPVKLHPVVPPGTILAWADNLPIQYQSPSVPNVAEVRARMDYYQLDFPQVSRQQMTGVYTEQVLVVYAPFAIGIINNIANG